MTMYFPQFLMSGLEPQKDQTLNKSLKDHLILAFICVYVCVYVNPIGLFSNVTLIIKFRWY